MLTHLTSVRYKLNVSSNVIYFNNQKTYKTLYTTQFMLTKARENNSVAFYEIPSFYASLTLNRKTLTLAETTSTEVPVIFNCWKWD